MVSEGVRKISFRVTNLVIRCPHCGKLLRICVGLLEKRPREKVEVYIEGGEE